ncbi:dnaJ homolog subfamily B member 9-like isoform X2 [Leguminivora glycinivorella]|uniref:dnaJ homolog subfamily B member 9-like isoform X2 n=1 Tax=Leguminivora glycinivorella TaxID=1035111 RepID=UPI00200C7222|nr:dnaJ homolog subfamily B member 9-like isoform X2 [Leguminivora glycinivorella]
MSKEYHPDKNKDARAQEKFVSIVEAYNVLGKPSSRAQYDVLSRSNSSAYVQRTHVPWKQSFLLHRENINEQSRIAAEELDKVRAKAEENGNESGPVLRENVQENVSASTSSYTHHPLGDLGGLFGDLLFLPESMEAYQVESESKSFTVLAEVLPPEDEVELQTRLLLEKIVNGANPTVATASLGQELATEKKDSPADRVLTEYGLSEDNGGDWYTSSFRSNIKKNPLGLAFEFETWFE